eukprot:74627-Chlamydomonas_euryale.AAC.9
MLVLELELEASDHTNNVFQTDSLSITTLIKRTRTGKLTAGSCHAYLIIQYSTSALGVDVASTHAHMGRDFAGATSWHRAGAFFLNKFANVCVDEAHCVAEWGHSFRPAYYRLGHVLRAVLRPRSVLALTATATRATERCIAEVCVCSTGREKGKESVTFGWRILPTSAALEPLRSNPVLTCTAHHAWLPPQWRHAAASILSMSRQAEHAWAPGVPAPVPRAACLCAGRTATFFQIDAQTVEKHTLARCLAREGNSAKRSTAHTSTMCVDLRPAIQRCWVYLVKLLSVMLLCATTCVSRCDIIAWWCHATPRVESA